MTALWDFRMPANCSAWSSWGKESPPRDSPPIRRKSRLEIPSQNRPLNGPQIFSICPEIRFAERLSCRTNADWLPGLCPPTNHLIARLPALLFFFLLPPRHPQVSQNFPLADIVTFASKDHDGGESAALTFADGDLEGIGLDAVTEPMSPSFTGVGL